MIARHGLMRTIYSHISAATQMTFCIIHCESWVPFGCAVSVQEARSRRIERTWHFNRLKSSRADNSPRQWCSSRLYLIAVEHLQVERSFPAIFFCRFKLSLRMIITFSSSPSFPLECHVRLFIYYCGLPFWIGARREKKKSLVLWNDYPAVCVFLWKRALNTQISVHPLSSPNLHLQQLHISRFHILLRYAAAKITEMHGIVVCEILFFHVLCIRR